MQQSEQIKVALELILNSRVALESIRPVGGGSISSAFALNTSAGEFFLKINQGSEANHMFEAELDGLRTLIEYSDFSIPTAYGATEVDGTAYLLMGLIQSTARSSDYWQQLASKLADLHNQQAEKFGYHRTNYIGSLNQINSESASWKDFFASQRMTPMIKLARDQGLVDNSFVAKFDAAIPKIVKEMPDESPSLVHGDLWSGNLMADESGNATIIDPAVYYGHREMDLAFSQMFGGFSNEFYQAYQEAYPMEPGFSERVGLYNLYPYLVHLNLFGRSYFSHIDYTIRQFT